MRAFWLGLAVVAMAVAARASDEADVKVGDWVKIRKTEIGTWLSDGLQMTVLERVKVIENGMAIIDIKTTEQYPGGNDPIVASWDEKIPLARLDSAVRYVDWDQVKREMKTLRIREANGNQAVEVSGGIFANILWRKAMITIETEDGQIAEWMVIEQWRDDEAPFVMARQLKATVVMTKSTPQGLAGSWTTMERVAYGRAGDPIPDDSD